MANEFKACSVQGCKGNGHYSAGGGKGLCPGHYKRLSRKGDIGLGRPLGKSSKDGSPRQLFIQSVALAYKGKDCLIWPFPTDKKGYGQLKIDGAVIGAHRYVCLLAKGNPPTLEHHAAHSCGKGHLGCVNPEQLSWKTPLENAADKRAHGTDNTGERNGRSELTEAQVLEILSLQGVKPKQEIANQFGVSRTTIHDIHARRTWASLAI